MPTFIMVSSCRPHAYAYAHNDPSTPQPTNQPTNMTKSFIKQLYNDNNNNNNISKNINMKFNAIVFFVLMLVNSTEGIARGIRCIAKDSDQNLNLDDAAAAAAATNANHQRRMLMADGGKGSTKAPDGGGGSAKAPIVFLRFVRLSVLPSVSLSIATKNAENLYTARKAFCLYPLSNR